jgi:cytochrome b561
MIRSLSYTKTAICLHWVIGLMIIAMLGVGLVMGEEGMWTPEMRGQLYGFHKGLGMIIIVLTLIRILWRFMNPPPALPAGMKPWEIFAVKATHFLFYGLLIILPLSGWAMSTAAGRAPIDIFGIFEWPAMPILSSMGEQKELARSISDAHGLLAYAMIGLLGLHVAAALKHHFINKDNVLTRMLPFLKQR